MGRIACMQFTLNTKQTYLFKKRVNYIGWGETNIKILTNIKI